MSLLLNQRMQERKWKGGRKEGSFMSPTKQKSLLFWERVKKGEHLSQALNREARSLGTCQDKITKCFS